VDATFEHYFNNSPIAVSSSADSNALSEVIVERRLLRRVHLHQRGRLLECAATIVLVVTDGASWFGARFVPLVADFAAPLAVAKTLPATTLPAKTLPALVPPPLHEPPRLAASIALTARSNLDELEDLAAIASSLADTDLGDAQDGADVGWAQEDLECIVKEVLEEGSPRSTSSSHPGGADATTSGRLCDEFVLCDECT